MHDLILKNGELIDGEGAYTGQFQIAITNGQIAEISKTVSRSAREYIDLAGKLVVPGMIDIHAHIYEGVTSIGMSALDMTFSGGVTAVADAGSCGSETFAGFRRWIADAAPRVFCFVNLSRLGLTGSSVAGELLDARYADPAGVTEILRAYPQVAIGVKLRASRDVVGGSCLPFLAMATQAAHAADRPVYVHIGNTAESIEQILAALGPGDVVTHYQTGKPGGLLDAHRRLWHGARDARQRGVLFDSGHGRTHFDFDVAARLLEEGFPPDLLSTDISLTSARDLSPGLVTVMNKWIALGLPVPDAIRACTVRPADSLFKGARFGRLKPGWDADIAVLAREEGDFAYSDAAGRVLRSSSRLVPAMTVRMGQLVWRAP